MGPLNTRHIGQPVIEGLSSFGGKNVLYVGALESVLYREVSFIQSAVYYVATRMVMAHFTSSRFLLLCVCNLVKVRILVCTHNATAGDTSV